MKKFIAIMVMLLIGLVANAQVTNGICCYELHLGGYRFKTEIIRDVRGLPCTKLPPFENGVFYTETADHGEALVLIQFLKGHKEKIEEKYGIHIYSCETTSLEGKEVSIHMCSKEYYEIEKSARAYRINSLNDIL